MVVMFWFFIWELVSFWKVHSAVRTLRVCALFCMHIILD